LAYNLTEGSIQRSIFRLALPMLAANLLQDLFNIVDTIFVGRLGDDQLAALTTSGLILGLIMVVMIGISTGTVALVARHIGSKERKKAENDAIQAILLAAFFTLVISPFLYFATPYLFDLLGADPEVIHYGGQYMRITAIGAFTISLSISMSASLQGSGDAMTPMKIMIFSTVLNIILDPLLIFGIGPLPEMGVAGSALATVVARGAGLPLFFYALLRGRTLLKLSLNEVKIDLRTMGAMFRIGIFSGLQALVRNISNFALIGLTYSFGTSTAAAYGVGTRLRMIVLMVGFAFAAASATLVGQNLGAGKPKRAEKSAWIAVGFYEVLLAALLLVFVLMPEEIMGIFSNTPEVVSIGAGYVVILGAAFPFLGLSVVLSRSFGGAGETKVPMIVTAISLIAIRIPLAYFLASTIGVSGIWYALLVSNIIEGSTFAFLFRRGKWKGKRVNV